MKQRITPKLITELDPNQIFVFGSNLSGIHGKGAAKIAHEKFGAEWGIGEGLTGNCYAFPTKAHDVKTPLTFKQMRNKMPAFWKAVKDNRDLDFFVTAVGTGYSRNSPTQMALLFSQAFLFDNVFLPKEWWRILSEVAKNGGLVRWCSTSCQVPAYSITNKIINNE